MPWPTRRERRSTAVEPGSPAARRRGFGRRCLAAIWGPIRFVLLALFALVIFIEEWGWRPLVAIVARLARWPPIAALEALIRRAPPRLALALFLVPAVLLVPVKIGALWLIHQGRATLGITVIVVAKLLGTALVGRLFILVETQLMAFAWFARCVGWWRATRDLVVAALRRSLLWRSAARLRRGWQQALRRLASFMD
jgi:hypothetical protein